MMKTKQIWAAAIAFCMVFMLIPMAAFAENLYEGSCDKNLKWTYDAEKRTLFISGTGDMPNYYSSSTEGSRAPWVNSKIKDEIETVVLSDGVTSIGEYAFFECTSLKTVTMPNSVISINKGAFYKCIALLDITFPASVTSIGDEAFQYCAGLKEITIPGSVKNIGENAFYDCYYYEMDDDYNITYSAGLEKVTIEDGVETIGGYAFYRCNKLNDVTLPDSVKSIGDNAFQHTGLYNDDSKWEVLYIGNHLIKADDWALNLGKTSDYSIIPGTKTIADSAFHGCSSLKSITLPNSVTSIGNHAFDSCNSLTCITIPNSVTSIGDEAFYTCFDLQSINVDPDNLAYCSENGVLYNKEKTEIIRFPKEKTEISFAIPASVTKIANGAFEYCDGLTSVTIPDGVTNIGNNAFEDCSSVTSITIPDNVTSVGNRAFMNCSSLTGITIPDGVPSIGESTFFKCSSLTSITLPNSVLIIEENAFKDCKKLKQVNYIGSEDDWAGVTGTGKYVLTNAGIHYLSGISAKHFADGKIVVKPINIDTGKTVILALYDGGKFIEMQQSSAYNDDNREIIFTPTQTYTRAKVMIWDSLGGMSPVCDFKVIE